MKQDKISFYADTLYFAFHNKIKIYWHLSL